MGTGPIITMGRLILKGVKLRKLKGTQGACPSQASVKGTGPFLIFLQINHASSFNFNNLYHHPFKHYLLKNA